MTEPADTGGLVDPETALQREVKALGQHSPTWTGPNDETVHVRSGDTA
jgi:hypothetical protein